MLTGSPCRLYGNDRYIKICGKGDERFFDKNFMIIIFESKIKVADLQLMQRSDLLAVCLQEKKQRPIVQLNNVLSKDNGANFFGKKKSMSLSGVSII